MASAPLGRALAGEEHRELHGRVRLALGTRPAGLAAFEQAVPEPPRPARPAPSALLVDDRRSPLLALGGSPVEALSRLYWANAALLRAHRPAEPSRGAQELVDGAAGREFVEPTEGCDDGLLDAFSFAAVFRDLKILIRADYLDADEHEASPSLTPHISRRLSRIFQCIGEYFLDILARIYHYISEQHRPDRFISS